MQVRYYRLPEEPSKFVEDLHNASIQGATTPEQLQEEDFLRSQQLEAQKNAERGQRLNAAKNLAKDVAKKEVKALAKKQVERVAARAAASGIVSSFPVWGPIVGVILLVICIIAAILIFFTSLKYECQENSLTGWSLTIFSKLADWTGNDNYAICNDMGFSIDPNAVGSTFSNRTTPLDPTAISDADARAQLAAAGIPVNALEPKTSLQGIKQFVIDETIRFANACSSVPNLNTCKVIVTGGTETTGGHASGPCSHLSGNKIDIDNNKEVNSYIFSTYTAVGTRSDGAALYRSPDGVVYALEDTHWDVVVAC